MINLEKTKTFVINLDRRVDRISEIKLPLKWERFSATDGKESFSNKPMFERGWRGCRDSHIRLLEKVKELDEDFFIIFEDDVEVGENFINDLEKITKTLPENWDLLFLGGWNVGDKIKYNDFLYLAKKVYCTHAFIIRKEIVEKMLNKFKEREFKVNVLLSELLPNINSFICNPTIAWQKPGFSDIENIITNNKHLR